MKTKKRPSPRRASAPKPGTPPKKQTNSHLNGALGPPGFSSLSDNENTSIKTQITETIMELILAHTDKLKQEIGVIMKLFQVQDRIDWAENDIVAARVLLGTLIEKMGYCKSLFEDVEELILKSEQNCKELKEAIKDIPDNN